MKMSGYLPQEGRTYKWIIRKWMEIGNPEYCSFWGYMSFIDEYVKWVVNRRMKL